MPRISINHRLAASAAVAIVLSALLGHPAQARTQVRAVPGRILVQLRPTPVSVPPGAIAASVGARAVGAIPAIGVHVFQLPAGANQAAAMAALARRPDVDFVEPDYAASPDMDPNDPYFKNQWHLTKIAGPTAWGTTTGSDSIIAAILDTGVYGAHPDLSAKMVPGWNFYDNNSNTSDVYGHGTMVAGTVAATSNNAAGVASVAWNCKIMPIRISDANGWGYTSMMASGLTWAADRGARVANISYNIAGLSSTVTSAAKYFMSKGGVVTVSAGNDSQFRSDADNPYILTVSATGGSDTLTSFSNYGNNIDVAAPGSSIYTTNRSGGYSSVNGTSFSAPVTAGVAVLALSVNPSLTGAELYEVVRKSAVDLGAAGWDPYYGWGRVDASRAVALAQGTQTQQDTTPPTVQFVSPANGATVSGTVNVQIGASDNVGVSSVRLTVGSTEVAVFKSAPYTYTWDTTKWAGGTYMLTATAYDLNGNSGVGQIKVTVSNGDTTPPTVSIASPASGSMVAGNVSVTVNAQDNIRVAKVELYVDGQFVGASKSAPFTIKWNTKNAGSGSHTLQCKAYDASSNMGVSAIVTVYKR